MAIKFPKVRPEDGEVIHPSDLLENVAEFTNEINGNLDSDNLNTAPSRDSFTSGSFYEIYEYRKTFSPLNVDDRFVCPHTTSAYLKVDDKNTKLAGVEIDATTDGWAIIDFNCTWLWTGNGITSVGMANDVMLNYLLSEPPYAETKLTAGGANLARTNMPPGGWIGFYGQRDDLDNPNNRFADGGFTESLSTPTGYGIEELSVTDFPLGQWCDAPVDHYAVQFRIVINGTVVSESGPLFNGNWRNSVYLCGATPVVAGKNNIDVEVRAYTAVELKTSRVGVGARDENDDPGKLFSYQLRSSEVHPAPLPKYEEGAISLSELDFADKEKESITGSLDAGIKCDIYDRNLLVQFRKR
jgi:hypothetical protein